jgi:hypothetical protein
MRRAFLSSGVLAVLCACANPGIVQMAPDTYVINRADRGGIFGNSARMQSEVIQEATDFAAAMGKVAIPLSSNSSPMFPGHFATFEYQFRVVDKDSPEARRAALKPVPNVLIENTTPAAPRDVYAELLRLEDLRKRGILTDAEFAAQKKKLLAD